MTRSMRIRREFPLHVMIFPAVLILLIFSYVPMMGIVIAFEKFIPARGVFHSKWIGLQNFIDFIQQQDAFRVVYNTVFIAVMKIVAGIVIPIIFALLLNEVSKPRFKRVVQTIIYLPYFLSWIILSGILIDVLSPSQGVINQIIVSLGWEPIFFLGNKTWFPFVMVITDTWKNFGFNTIIYLAALSSIDPTYYEAAMVDGAGHMQQVWHITLPGMLPIVTLITVLSLGNVLNAGFEQIFTLYNSAVYATGDIIDTKVYRLGLQYGQFGVATAVGLFKSVVSFFLISTAYKLADKLAGYRVF